jgi:hypothetical protein
MVSCVCDYGVLLGTWEIWDHGSKIPKTLGILRGILPGFVEEQQIIHGQV